MTEHPEFTPSTRRFYDKVKRQWHLDVHHLELLRSACKTLDNIALLEADVGAHGFTVKDRHGQEKPRPAALLLRDYRGLLARLLRELALTEDASDTRPAALRGRYKSRA